MRTFLITGGAGFVGTTLSKLICDNYGANVVVIDKMGYASNRNFMDHIDNKHRIELIKEDICNTSALKSILFKYSPEFVLHLAAESHVDRSIESPKNFIFSNIVGTFSMLEAAREYYSKLNSTQKEKFRFHHVSTDEIFGSLDDGEQLFHEQSEFKPSSPYSASKASSNHLVMAWNKTFKLPVSISNCSNNYGPYQFPEKLMPLIITNCIEEMKLPIYGTGDNIRDWLHVEDHASAIISIATNGKVGSVYNVGGHVELSNYAVVTSICQIMDKIHPRSGGKSYKKLISHVNDRPGHDFRYAINSSKIQSELDWRPKINLENGLKSTIMWYLNNSNWWRPLKEGFIN